MRGKTSTLCVCFAAILTLTAGQAPHISLVFFWGGGVLTECTLIRPWMSGVAHRLWPQKSCFHLKCWGEPLIHLHPWEKIDGPGSRGNGLETLGKARIIPKCQTYP